MTSIGIWLDALFVTVGGFILLGAALALIRGSYSKARIEALRGANEDLRNRVEDLEKGESRLRVEQDKLKLRCSHLDNENKLLEKLVTQRADVQTVMKRLDKYHTDVMAKFDEIKLTLGRIET